MRYGKDAGRFISSLVGPRRGSLSSTGIPALVELRDQFRIVELASSELWNLRGCNSVLLREAVMARLLLPELLLFSCMAAFAIGVVIAAASIIG
jgi:hypothetical protein